MATAKATAYDVLRGKILDGEYESGFQLKELELADQLGVSRTPARQAIKRLAAEGLVLIRPNRRSYVADFDVEQFHQMFDILAFLEGYSAGLAATHIDADQIAELRRLNEEMAACDFNKSSGQRAFSLANTRFHSLIHESCGNDRLCAMILPLVELAGFLFSKHGRVDRHTSEHAIDQHAEIIDALESGNRRLARLQMELHRESVRAGFTALWEDLEAGTER